MTKYYKTKETAIKWIKAGKGFTNVGFDLFREHRDIFILAMQYDPNAICTGVIPPCFQNDREIARLFMERPNSQMDVFGLLSIGKEILSDKDFVMRYVHVMARFTQTWFYSILSDDLKADREVAFRFVQYYPSNIVYLPNALKTDDKFLIHVASNVIEVADRSDSTLGLISYLGLPNLENEQIIQYIKTRALHANLQASLPDKEITQTVKI